MLTTRMLIDMVAWPALAAIAVLALAWVPPLARSPARALLAPLAIAVGFAVGYWVVVGRPELLPPADARARLPHVAVIGLAVAAVAAFSSRRAVVWTAIALGSLAAMRLLLAASIAGQWSAAEAIARVLILAAGLALITIATDGLVRRLAPRTAAAGLIAVGALAAPLMLFSDTLLLAQMHGTLGVAVGVTAVAVWLAPRRIALGAVAPVIVAVAWSHWIIALLFASMPVVSFALLAAAVPAALTAGSLVQHWRPRLGALATLLTVAMLVAGSLAVGGLRYARTTQASDGAAASDSGNDYGYAHDD